MKSLIISFISSFACWLLFYHSQQRIRWRRRESKPATLRAEPKENESLFSANFAVPFLAIGLVMILVVLEPDLRDSLAGDEGITKTGVFVLLCLGAAGAAYHIYINSRRTPWQK